MNVVPNGEPLRMRSRERKPYVRQAEAVTFRLLPDSHHGEFVMRVLSFPQSNLYGYTSLKRNIESPLGF